MKIHITVFILILCINKPINLSAQANLFNNPSFEDYSNCINRLSNDTFRLVKGWSQPTLNGATLTNTCDEDFWRPYLRAEVETRTGNAVQYILTWYSDTRAQNIDFRSYIVTKLKKPLVANAKYFFRGYMRCIFNNLDGFCKTNNQGIAFSEAYPKDVPVGQGAIDLKPVIKINTLVDSFWTEISGCFTAKGGEEYAVIGNFSRRDSTKVERLAKNSTTELLIGSYIIDDVLLVPLNLELPRDTAVCEGDTLILNANTYLPATFKWQDGSTIPQFKVNKGGTYSVSISYTINGAICQTEQHITVKMLPRYQPLTMVDTTLCFAKSILLKVGTGRKDDTIVWQDNSTKDTLRVLKKGIYTAQITNSCGRYSQTFDVNFALCNIHIYVPNAFSPNGDTQNDTFYPFIKTEFPIVGFEFTIYNRLGDLMYQSTEQTDAWDGTFKNKPIDSDVYIWFLKLKINLGGRIVEEWQSGDVSLLR